MPVGSFPGRTLVAISHAEAEMTKHFISLCNILIPMAVGFLNGVLSIA